jgi:hypothetical protein
MKKSGLYFLAAALLAAMVLGACMSPFETPEDPVEYDAQGRRLVTVTVDLDSAARGVNTPLAQAYIDFYEVVFVGPDPATEYYSATTTKGAGKRLSLRVPVGDYIGYLNAGYLEGSNNAVLLAQAVEDDGSGGALPIKGTPWSFTLTALNLKATGAGPNSATGDKIYVKYNSSTDAPIKTAYTVPYYEPSPGDTVAVLVTTGVENAVGTGIVEVKPLIRKGDEPPVQVNITASPTFSSGVLSFGFTAPATGAGLSNIGFDVEVNAVAPTRSNGVDPVLWHIRNGLYVEQYDNGKDDATNTGAGIIFAFGGAVPNAMDTYAVNVPLP